MSESGTSRRGFLRTLLLAPLGAALLSGVHAVLRGTAHAARSFKRMINLSPQGKNTPLPGATWLSRYRDLLLRRGAWSSLPIGGGQKVLVDGKIQVISGGPPAGAIVLGYGDVRVENVNGTWVSTCQANVISTNSFTGDPDCPGESVDDCKKLSCTGMHCKGQDCGEFGCEVVSCKGAECGDFESKVVTALASEMQGNWEHPFVVDLRTQLEVDQVRSLAMEVNDLVSGNGAAR